MQRGNAQLIHHRKVRNYELFTGLYTFSTGFCGGKGGKTQVIHRQRKFAESEVKGMLNLVYNNISKKFYDFAGWSRRRGTFVCKGRSKAEEYKKGVRKIEAENRKTEKEKESGRTLRWRERAKNSLHNQGGCDILKIYRYSYLL